jgi:Mg-chelatase subunit ChlD
MNNQIVVGSLGALSKNSNQSLAESFMSAEVIILTDTSGSMGQHDANQGRSRYDQACHELTQLQASMPGKIAVVSFSDEVQFCPSGIPFNFMGGTDLAKGLRFIHAADCIPGMKFIVVSDGQPDSESDALAVARKFKNHIDVIYVGSERHPEGREFLERLAKATGGQSVTAEAAKQLASTVQTLLLKA